MSMKPIPTDLGFAPPLPHLTVETHDNGGRAFKVILDDQGVVVWRLEYRETSEAYVTVGTPFVYRPHRVFVGRSPKNAMTMYSGGHGKRFYGNSVLLDRGGGWYVHIGTEIIQFHTDTKIEWFMSPVGNSDVPYPYAVDSLGSVYLLTEGVVLVDGVDDTEDPTHSYSDRSLITPDMGCVPPQMPAIAGGFEGIEGWYMDGEPFTLRYTPHAAKDYDRLMRTRNHVNEPMYIKVGGVRKEIDKAAYVDLMARFGAASGFMPIESVILAPREV